MLRGLFPMSAGIVLLLSTRAVAHDFGLGGSVYDDFISGCAAVLFELPLMITLMTAGIWISLWDREGLPRVWLAFAAGVSIGLALALADLIEPVPVSYGAAIAFGLLAAAAIKPDLNFMRIIVFLAGLLPAISLLAGHALGTVPPGAYAGIFVMFNLVLAVSAGITAFALRQFRYNWVPIAFRALASWMVAIALMSFAFLMR